MWFALALIVTAQFMVVLDVAIVNVALPSIKTDLNFSQENLQWVITAYSIFFGGVLLLGGRLADLLGRRRLFIAGILLFTVSSLLDGLAWSEGSLIAFRFSWSWIFFINVPVGLLVLGLSPVLLRASRADLDHRHFDSAGAASITGGLMVLVYAMTRATQHGWATAETIGLLVAAAVLIVSFVVIELRSKAPLLPMRIFRLRSLTAANVSGLLLGGAIFAQFFLLTLYMQQVLHYSAIKTGVAYIALTLTIIAFSGVAQALVTRLGVRRVLTTGMVVSAVGLVLYSQLPVDGHYFWDLFPAFLLSGIGLALAFVPMSIGALTGVTSADAGVASGLINTSQQIGGAIGVAVATTIAATLTANYVDVHPGANALSGGALTHGFQGAFYVLAGITVFGAVVAAVFTESHSRVADSEPIENEVLAEAA